MSLTAYPTLRLRLTPAPAFKLRFLPAIPGFNASGAANKVDKSGDVMTGFLTLNANPVDGLHAATKQYVDATAGGGSFQPLDADLTSLATASGTNTIYYRSAASAWSPVTIGANLTFSGGTLAATGAGGGAPTTAEYITSSSDATLSAERVLTNTASITWDFATPGQAKANTAAGGGNVSNSGTPTANQYGRWVTATTIAGVAPATVLSDIGAAASTDFPAGAWTAWTPTLSSSGGSLASATTNTARYTKQGKVVNLYVDITINSVGTATGYLQVTLPVNASSSGGGAVSGIEVNSTGALVGGQIFSGATFMQIANYLGATILVAGYRVRCAATYEGV